MTLPEFDYVILGAGPAGMAAALTAREHGLTVLVLEEQSQPGGQIYRNIESFKKTRPREFRKLGEEYQLASRLVEQFRQCGAEHWFGRSVWQVSKDLCIYHVDSSGEQEDLIPSAVQAKKLLISVGALERPMPIPGWTLPGVMACTAADVLYKTSGLVPKGQVVLAGSGPLMLLIACRMLDTGVSIGAILDIGKRTSIFESLALLPKALRGSSYLFKGISMIWKLRKAGVRIVTGIQSIEAIGTEKLEQVRFTKGIKSETLKSDLLLLHHGVVPNVQMTRLLGCEHEWYEEQRYWEPRVDKWGNTSIEGVSIAGDCGRIAGSQVAEVSGHLAALDALYQLKIISKQKRDQKSKPWFEKRKPHMAVRPFLDKLFQPSKKWLVPENQKCLVCRCEEVTVGQIREAVQKGALSPDRIKSLFRCGMGPCQGRMCGLTVSEIIADEIEQTPREVGYFKIRPPLRPITLGQLSQIQ